MQQYHLIRRIQPENSQWHPTFQIVYCHTDKAKVEDYLKLLQLDEKLASLSFISYSIERHPDTISGKELERQFLLKERRNKEIEKQSQEMLAASARNRTWADVDELISEGY